MVDKDFIFNPLKNKHETIDKKTHIRGYGLIR